MEPARNDPNFFWFRQGGSFDLWLVEIDSVTTTLYICTYLSCGAGPEYVVITKYFKRITTGARSCLVLSFGCHSSSLLFWILKLLYSAFYFLFSSFLSER